MLYLGLASATPGIPGELGAMLCDDGAGTQEIAASAVGALGGAVGTPEIVRGLTGLLSHEKEQTRRIAAEAIERLMDQGLRLFHPSAGEWVVRCVQELGGVVGSHPADQELRP